MRAPFTSERRCISNLFQMKWGVEAFPSPPVLNETIAEPTNPKRKPWFNCDFILDFVDWRAFSAERLAAACSVLPNSLGAELFLVVDATNLSPTALELNGGAAFPITRYASWIQIIEAAIQDAIASRPRGANTGLPNIASSEVASIRRAAFARVLVVGNDITFLFCPRLTRPMMRGQRFALAHADDREIDCYLDGGEWVCFDGWIRAEVIVSERVLISMPERTPCLGPTTLDSVGSGE